MQMKTFMALALMLTPSLAFARPRTITEHPRPPLFRDRTPKAHIRETHVHDVHQTSSKFQPPAQAKQDF
jgi:hypothetical protein